MPCGGGWARTRRAAHTCPTQGSGSAGEAGTAAEPESRGKEPRPGRGRRIPGDHAEQATRETWGRKRHRVSPPQSLPRGGRPRVGQTGPCALRLSPAGSSFLPPRPWDVPVAPLPCPHPCPTVTTACQPGGGLAPSHGSPAFADTQHVCRVHGAPRHPAAGQQRQGHARLAVRIQPPPGRDHTVRGSPCRWWEGTTPGRVLEDVNA